MKRYMKSFLITLFCAFIFFIGSLFVMAYNAYTYNGSSNIPAYNRDEIEAYLVDMLIEKNLYLEKYYPKLASINIKLGALYSYKQDYVSAEKELKEAIAKANANDFRAHYQLSKLYIKMHRFAEAQAVMDNLGEKPNKKLIKYKGDIYKSLGDKCMEKGFYDLAVTKYEKSLFYFNKINYKKTEEIKKSLVTAHMYIADYYVTHNAIGEAVVTLEKANAIKEHPIINYKIGLLEINNNPKRAAELFAKVHKYNPKILNSQVYIDLLTYLSVTEEKNGNTTAARLYRSRAKSYKKFIDNYLLDDNDLLIDVLKTKVEPNDEKKAYEVFYQFKLKNNSQEDINNLTILITFEDDFGIFEEVTQKIYSANNVFKIGAETQPLGITSYYRYNKTSINSDVTVKVYAYKYPKYKVLLNTQNLRKY